MAFNTGSSIFGKPAGGSLFGGTQQNQPATGGFSLANAPPLGSTPSTQPTTGLFSNLAQNQQNQPAGQTGGLFGQPQTQNTGGGLFGQNTQTQGTNTGGGLFGGQNTQTQGAATGGGLFGQNTQNQAQNTTGGLFGQPQQTQTQTQPAGGLFGGGSLFGSTNTAQPQQQQQQQPQSNLFGGFGTFGTNNQQQQQQQQQQQPGLFGTATNNPFQPQGAFPTNAFGQPGASTLGTNPFGNRLQQPGSLLGQPGVNQGAFGASTQQNLQNNFNVSQAPPPFTKSTKFNDLPDSIKKAFENIDAHIQGRVQISKDLQQRKLAEEPTKGHEAIRDIQKDLINTTTAIRDDHNLTQDIKQKVDQAVEDTIVATRIIDAFRNPQSGTTHLKDHANFPLEYFTRVADQLKARLDWYQSTIEQIERKLSSQGATPTPQSISITLQAQHATFIALAGKTAAVEAELQKVKALFTQLWRAKTGSVRDPFNDASISSEANDFGMSSLNVR